LFDKISIKASTVSHRSTYFKYRGAKYRLSGSIKRQALKEKMITLQRDGVNKILNGLTTADEILLITKDLKLTS
jgi:hypothetical protein